MNNSLIQLISIRYKEFLREPGILFWTIFFPVAMAWGLGMAFSGESSLTTNVAVIENNAAPNAPYRHFIDESEIFTNKDNSTYYIVDVSHPEFGLTHYHLYNTDSTGAQSMLKRGITSLILKEQGDSLHYLFDPKNSDAKLTYLLLNAAINDQEATFSNTEVKPLKQVGTRYIDFLIPGLIALGVMNSFLWGISYALIDMRVKKLMRRMIATPMKKSYFLISHFFARISLAFLEASILIGFSRFYFGIEILGGILPFLVIFIAGNIAFTGMGVIVGSRTSNSRVGTAVINLITMPMMLASGIFFSYHGFPEPLRNIIEYLPLTILADNIRSVFIEGAGIAQVLPGSIILSSLGLVLFGIGLKIFKWY